MNEEKELANVSSHSVDPAPTSPSSSLHRLPPKRLHDDHHCSLFYESGTLLQNPKKAKKSPQCDPLYPLPILPHEILVEILSWLPVRTLIQFRCVSKSFKSLISDHEFIKTHLRKIKSFSGNKPNLYQRIVFTYGDLSLNLLKSCSLYSIFNNSQTDAAELDHYSLEDRHRHHVYDWLVGSLDGVLCVAVKQNFVALWNPSTGVFNRMPDLGFGKKSGSYTVFGFGYDREIDDYKVVAVFCFQSSGVNGAIGYNTRVKVCSRLTESWKSIEGFRYGVPYDVSGKYVNGSLSWPVMCERDSVLTWIIVSFDLAKETYKEIVQPNYGEPGYARSLGVLDGCLCVMCNYSAVRADIWVMKEYGVRESWTKLVSIPYLIEPEIGHLQYSVPYFISDNGEILLELNSRLAIYNPKDGTFRYPVTNGSGNWVDAELYIESLVSPKIEN
ncbi:hypothetical protein JCGZ_02077 [Jatropha curcas]|uniref:F-box domain-containing protein n=1 Tax=Jatropha curcas TaxID=180498 RepID=A0A067L7K8_JATCU|nr:F-box/kelch-repeat protein At3g23880 [Jatropha curcas]KDP40079.1 hypothetical protein JCGZ_02077 [Jatropha curcas]